MLLDRFYPDEYVDSAYEIDYEMFYKKGYRGIIFDIDNTLVEHGAPANERAKALFERLESIGYESCLVSNNDRDRVDLFNIDIGAFVVDHANKPSRKGYIEAMELMETTRRETLSIGDQLFTDIWGSHRIGIYSILVKPISKKEEIQIRLKRILERIVLYFYKRNKSRS